MLLIFGLDENGKKIKRALLASGCDKTLAKSWLTFYKKVKRISPQAATHYHRVKEDAKRILAESREVEKLLVKEGGMDAADKKRFRELLADFTATRPGLDFEFVISSADKEIHLTLQGLEQLGSSWLEGKADKIILQSEIENLMALVREALEKEKPDLSKLAVFYVNHTDKELEELSYSSRLMMVEEIYQAEYVEPIREAMRAAAEKGLPEALQAEDYLDSIIRI